jgi:hypothetical protein
VERLKLNRAALLIALLAFSCFAQEPSQQSEPEKNQCVLSDGVSSSGMKRWISQSGTAKVELFRVEAPPVKSKCDFLSLVLPKASPGKELINNESSDQVQRGELFSFESRVARSMTTPSGLSARPPAAPTQTPATSASDAQELAKKLSNPVASLISLPLQSNFDFGMGTGSGWRYTLNVQPVIPIALGPKWNMISRTIIPIIHQGNVTGPNTSQSGLGDIVQSFFFSPNKTEPIIWAVGPVVLIPTATDDRLGAQKWGLGPTALALKQKKGWTYGVLANHIWSVAGKSNRGDVSATFIQPFLSYSNKQAWTYSINTESTYDWISNSWSIPINPFISKLVRFGKQPVSFGGGLKCWVTTPTGGPEGCGLRIVVTALFPKK